MAPLLRFAFASAAGLVLALAIPPTLNYYGLPPDRPDDRFVELFYLDGGAGLLVGLLLALSFVRSIRATIALAVVGAALAWGLFMIHVQTHEYAPTLGKCVDCEPLLGGGYVPGEDKVALRNMFSWWIGVVIGSAVVFVLRALAQRIAVSPQSPPAAGARVR